MALGLTAMVTGLTWMIFKSQGNPNANTITFGAGFIFLAFFSARMAVQYFRDDIVLSILPTGIQDERWAHPLVEWEQIKEIILRQRESQFELNVHLWPTGETATVLPIDLDALESDVDVIVDAILVHKRVRNEV